MWGAAALGVVGIGAAAVALVGATGPLLQNGAGATVVATAEPSSTPPPAEPSSVAPTSSPMPEPTAPPVPPPTPEPAAALPAAAGPNPTAPSVPTAPASDPRSSALGYESYDATGQVLAAGSYALLSDASDTTTAVTTYGALRDGTATALVVNTSDRYGASQQALYDAVEAGDLVEWRKADDCFVRYAVTEVKPDPPATASRKLLGVESVTYAFTGCSGPVSASVSIARVIEPRVATVIGPPGTPVGGLISVSV